ncbi:MAG: polysaccharide deacetylase family protein [Bryobacterales bacterium]|nr:polysaccharide deacetylase family protein [Bryobacterales bacterium]
MARRAVRSVGVNQLATNSAWRTNRLLVLCYHGISLDQEHDWRPGLFLSLEVFEARLRAIAEGGYNVLPLDEAMERLAKKSLPAKSVAITFDDGFADFAILALPVLKKFQFPATVYLTTWYALRNKPLFNLAVPYMLWKQRDCPIGAAAHFGWDRPPDLRTEIGRAAAWVSVQQYVTSRQLSSTDQFDLQEEIAAVLGFDYQSLVAQHLLRIMTPAEASAVAAQGFPLELHTHRHRTPEAPDLFVREIHENRDHIRAISGTEPRHFCYPSGVYRPAMLPLLRQCGVQSATTCISGLAEHGTEPLLVPRMLDLHNRTQESFEGWLSGVEAFLHR